MKKIEINEENPHRKEIEAILEAYRYTIPDYVLEDFDVPVDGVIMNEARTIAIMKNSNKFLPDSGINIKQSDGFGYPIFMLKMALDVLEATGEMGDEIFYTIKESNDGTPGYSMVLSNEKYSVIVCPCIMEEEECEISKYKFFTFDKMKELALKYSKENEELTKKLNGLRKDHALVLKTLELSNKLSQNLVDKMKEYSAQIYDIILKCSEGKISAKEALSNINEINGGDAMLTEKDLKILKGEKK